MAEYNRITDGLLAPDSNTRRFHAGADPQAGIPADLTDEEQAALDVHRAQIKAPDLTRPLVRGTIPRQGLVMNHETGTLEPIPVDERGKLIQPTARERRAATRASQAEQRAEMRGETADDAKK